MIKDIITMPEPEVGDDDDVFYLFLQNQKRGAELHISLEEGTYHKRLLTGAGPSASCRLKRACRTRVQHVRAKRFWNGLGFRHAHTHSHDLDPEVPRTSAMLTVTAFKRVCCLLVLNSVTSSQACGFTAV